MSLLRRGASRLAGSANASCSAVNFGELAPFVRLFAAPSKGRGARSGEGSKQEMFVEMLKPQKTPPPPKHTPEDAERAKQYSRLKMGEHRKFQADLSRKLKLMQAAVAALPEDLREAAMQPDLALMPAKRQIPLVTPNIEGYYEGKQQEAEQATGFGGGKRR